MKSDDSRIESHPVVSHEEWLAARTALLAKEKEVTRLCADLTEQRRRLQRQRRDVLGEFRRLLAPGGVLCFLWLPPGQLQAAPSPESKGSPAGNRLRSAPRCRSAGSDFHAERSGVSRPAGSAGAPVPVPNRITG